MVCRISRSSSFIKVIGVKVKVKGAVQRTGVKRLALTFESLQLETHYGV